ncbi:MAG TPA: LamG-like jellyroll fold domain-containing protein, partial [Verrucomicrobiae bacterium]
VLTNVAPQLNVTGTNPMSVITWYKANPADVYNRFQNILGHSDSGWRIGFSTTGPRFNPGGGGEIDSSDLYNDSRWHMLAGVYDSTSNYLYMDGKLVKTAAYTGSQSGSVRDVILGGDPQYTTPAGRYFDGRIAQVAFFTNAISAGSILSLYSNAQIYPFIVGQPTSANVNAGTAYTNSVTIGGSPTLSYQWYQNGTAVANQTNLNLVFAPITGDDAGNYYLVVTNNGGAVTSSVVALTVNTSPQITALSGTNYILFTGGSATLSVAAIGANPVYYYWYSNNVAVAASTNATSYLLTNASLTTAYTVVASNYLGAVSNVVMVTVESQPTDTYPQAVLADRPIGYWRMDETDTGYPNTGVPTYDYWGGHNGSYMNTELSQAGYSATPPDPDTAALFGDFVDSDSYAGQIPGIDFGTATGNAELSVEAWVNVPAGQLHDGGVITKGTGAGGEQFNLDTGAGSHAFRFFVRDAAGNVHLANSTVIPDGVWHHVVGVCDEVNGSIYLYIDGALAASTTISAGSGLLNSANPVSIGSRQGGASGAYDQQLYGTVDEVAIYDHALSPAQIAAHYYAIGGFAPVITAQPTNITANAGSTVTFSATVGGSPTLTYQWYDVTGGFPGTAITGATNTSLTLTDITAAQNGKLFAIVAGNNVSQTTSSAAQLTVVSGPPILQTDLQPLYTKAFVGLPLTFTVSVGGTPPFHYQWYQDGSPAGPNAATYTLPVIAGTNTYSCTITNAAGSISSSTATVIGVAITDTGTNTSTSSTTFAVNFMDAAQAGYTVDNGNNWTNVVYQGLGAYPDAPVNTNWNGFGQFPNGYLPEFNSTVSPQVASDGTLTPITLSLIYGFDSGSLYYGPPDSGYVGNTAQGDPSLMLGECAVVNGSSPGYITFSNVPPGSYSLYLYAANVNNDRGATFNFTSGSPLGGTNVVINADPGSGPASNFVYGVTYVIYTGVAPDTNGVITGTWGPVSNPISGNTGEGDFNGLQLVRVSGPVAALPTLTIQGSGTNVIINWTPTSGTLQSAASLTGTFTDIAGATSPYTNSVSGAQQFFRVKVQ